MRMKKSVKINKEKNGISFRIKNVEPIKPFLEKGNPKEDVKERPYRRQSHIK